MNSYFPIFKYLYLNKVFCTYTEQNNVKTSALALKAASSQYFMPEMCALHIQ